MARAGDASADTSLNNRRLEPVGGIPQNAGAEAIERPADQGVVQQGLCVELGVGLLQGGGGVVRESRKNVNSPRTVGGVVRLEIVEQPQSSFAHAGGVANLSGLPAEPGERVQRGELGLGPDFHSARLKRRQQGAVRGCVDRERGERGGVVQRPPGVGCRLGLGGCFTRTDAQEPAEHWQVERAAMAHRIAKITDPCE